MANVLVNDSYLTGIANAIRTKSSSQDTFLPSEMPQAILDIPTGSGGSEPNIFVQTTEPDTKKGIWLQKNATPDYYTYDEEVFVGGTWLEDGSKANIPYNFKESSTATVGTNVYLLGGSSYPSYNYKYDTLTDTYTKLTNLPYSFYHGSATTIGTDIYLFGGDGGNTNNYKYDTVNGTYTKLANIPYSFYNGAVASVGTNIYLFGSQTSSYYKYAYKYNTLTDTYTQLTNIPYNFYYGKIAVVGTDIYLFGGSGASNRTYKYDTLTNTYTQLTNIPYSFVQGSAVAVGTDVYLFGGSSGVSKNAYKYSILTDTYTQLTDIPYNFYFSEASAVNNYIYLFGGTSYPTKVQVYVLESKTYQQDNLVVILQGNSGYKTELYSNVKDVTPPKYSFLDAWYYTIQGGLETDIPTYYGNDTAWTKIKN